MASYKKTIHREDVHELFRLALEPEENLFHFMKIYLSRKYGTQGDLELFNFAHPLFKGRPHSRYDLDGTISIPDGLTGVLQPKWAVIQLNLNPKGFRGPDCPYHQVKQEVCDGFLGSLGRISQFISLDYAIIYAGLSSQLFRSNEFMSGEEDEPRRTIIDFRKWGNKPATIRIPSDAMVQNRTELTDYCRSNRLKIG